MQKRQSQVKHNSEYNLENPKFPIADDISLLNPKADTKE